MSFRTEAMGSFLRERLANLPRNNAFTLIKADGHVLIGTRAPADMDLSDRVYFRHFATIDDPGPFISAPLLSRVLGTGRFIARRINGRITPSSVLWSERSTGLSHRLLSGDKIAAQRNRHSFAATGLYWSLSTYRPGWKVDAGDLALVSARRRARRHLPLARLSHALPRWSRCASFAPGRW
jgi:hypothetical protein